MDPRSWRGGSLKLCELIAEHPQELAYDLRCRFQFGIDDIGSEISLKEAVLLVGMLLRDPSNWITATQQGWSYPVSREWMALAHTYDLHAAVNSGKGKKPQPYPNPFPDKTKTRVGKTDRSPEEVRRILARLNPKET